MEEITKKEHVQIGERRILREITITNPTEATLHNVLHAQLARAIVRKIQFEFRLEPIIEATGDEVDIFFTGDVEINIRCHSWNEIDRTKGDDHGKDKEKT